MAITDAIIDAARTLELAATNPLAAAVELEALADQLREAARFLRERTLSDDGIRSPGGIGDKVRIKVTRQGAGAPRPPTYLADEYRGPVTITGEG